MTVLRMNAYREYSAPRRRGFFSVRRHPACRRVKVRTGRHYTRLAGHTVIAEKRMAAPAFSAGGVRRDVLRILLALILVLFVSVLLADLSALCSGGTRIGKLSAEIRSINSSNTLLQEELARISAHPVPVMQNQEKDAETVITLSAAIP